MRIIAESLAMQYPDQSSLFKDLGFRMSPGETVAIIGPSGSGKTSLLSILCGWTQPTQGTLSVEGVDRIAWVFQNPYGVAKRSVLDHVVLPFLARGFRRRSAELEAKQLLHAFGLSHLADRPFATASGGEAQRIMLARALGAMPDLLLLDEPTAQLDPAAADLIVGSLDVLRDSGTIVAIATHDARVANASSKVIDLGDFQ